MAHGEMVMLGAYTTFVVQEAIRAYRAGPVRLVAGHRAALAFLVAGAVGIAIERGIIRFLYGRPLETLLATWGVSLILQQAVRSIFGPTNREVGNPLLDVRRTEIGDRRSPGTGSGSSCSRSASSRCCCWSSNRTPGACRCARSRRTAAWPPMGIRTPWVDALTFGLGSGIAGIAGVALSQIDNVSPNLGQGYIIDSFMVVVFGGVGNLWGTLVGAFRWASPTSSLSPMPARCWARS
jgi:urea transport system permease protein